MIQTKIYTFTINAGATFNLPVVGEYFKILTASGLVNVTAPNVQLEGIGTGQGVQNFPFTALVFKDVSGAANTVSVLIGDPNFIDSLTGTVAVSAAPAPVVPALTHLSAAVGAASAQISPAKVRKYLMIQNNDPANAMWVTSTVAATTALGIKIPPGGNYEPPVVPQSALNAIGSAGMVNCTVHEA